LLILYVGRIHPEKGLDILIAAFRRIHSEFPKARLRVVGPASLAAGGGGEAYLKILTSAADGLPVEFPGPISAPEVLALEYQAAHCFCYPSLAERGEALGLAALEAMATGLPVVVSDLACFRDFISPDHDGLIFNHRTATPDLALAERLAQVLGDSTGALALGSAAADTAHRFDLRNIAQNYLSFFESVVGR
jgi:glycosyltransferase involved in cell wall biosynthesis